MDIESFRECFGYITAADNAVELPEERQALLEAEDADDFFGEGDMVGNMQPSETTYDVESMQQQTQRVSAEVNVDNGAYNLVAIKLNPEISLKEGEERLRRVLADANAGVKVLTWKQAAGEAAQFATMTQYALSVFVLFLFFVAIIVIMNTLSMAALERTAEIGMMRAVGAKKSFVTGMFFAETSLLSAIFGGLGIFSGVIVSWVMTAMNIATTKNDILSLLFGGDTFKPIINVMGVISGIEQVAIVTLLAMLYPILVARKITPLEAISRD
jgi:putative ABC transport system permease protein